MSEPWVVLKFGGTSVAGKAQWEAIAGLVRARRASGQRVLVVCSALAGVTNALQALADKPESCAGIIDRHRRLADELNMDAEAVMAEGEALLEAAVAQVRDKQGPLARAELLAMGEWLSTRLGCLYLAQSMTAEWADAREALRANPESSPDSRRARLAANCDAFVDEALRDRWTARAPVLVTQGFLVASENGGTALLGRGGSDTSAALLASRLGAERVEIWTDVPGLFSADPRLEPAALPIAELSYAEALEMAAGGARVVHGRSIRAAAEVGIPMEIRELGNPNHPGTTISGRENGAAAGIRAVISQSNMAVLLLENLDTRQQVGFLAGVFASIAAAGISVDLVATSETTTTLAINRDSNALDKDGLDALAASLARLCRVQLFEDSACVNLVGRGASTALGGLGPASDLFCEQPLLMMSHSANDLSISLLVHADDAPGLARRLHQSLVAP